MARLPRSRCRKTRVYPRAPDGGARPHAILERTFREQTDDEILHYRKGHAVTGALEGRAAVITGANQGLGFAIAEAYVAAGAHVLICARDQAKLAGALCELAKTAGPGQKVLGETADVSSATDVARLVARAHAEFPSVQILVNNAGVYGPLGSIEDADWSEWVRALEINLFGSVLMCRALLPH